MLYNADISRYQIIKKIGEGGGGTVYLAMDAHLQKQVVVKRIKGEVSVLDSRTEVDILKNLRHSYIPQVFDFIENMDGQYVGLEPGIYTVMDFIPGKSLQKMLDEHHQFTEKEVVKYGSQLCEALAYLHKLNPPLIHGDIKPDNIMVTPEDNVCLIDFNISGFLEGKSIETNGYTPGYSSPEQIEAFKYTYARFMVAQNTTGENNFIGSPAVSVGAVGPDDGYVGNSATVAVNNLPQQSETVLLDASQRQDTYTGSDPTVLRQPSVQEPASTAASADTLSRKGAPVVDARSDIYSVGATLYTLLTGKFVDLSSKKLKLSNKISDGLRIILGKALDRKPRNRYQDAGEMLGAFNRVHEMNRSYRNMIIGQRIKLFLLTLFAVIGIVLVNLGGETISAEREEKYTQCVSRLQTAVERNLSVNDVNELFDTAISIHDNRLEPYYAKAFYLYTVLGMEYDASREENTVDFLGKATENLLTGEDAMYSNLYYLYADCLFNSENYSEAIENYRLAMMHDNSNFSIYRDYAISFIYEGREDEAVKLLTEAEKQGVAQEDIYLIRGELERSYGNYEKAVEYFKLVTASVDDDYLLQRAYVMADKCYTAIGTADALKLNIENLKEAVGKLSMNNRVLIYEALAQAYISLGEAEDDKSCFEHACEIFENVLEMNWGSYVTYSNLIVLNQRLGNFDEACVWADKMIDRYPDNYIAYMRRAFVELELQAHKDEQSRDYATLVDYYNRAEDKYARIKANNQTDSEMLLLENAYQQLVDGNWLN